MRYLTAFILISTLMLTNNPLYAANNAPARERLLADFGWKFVKGDPQGADKAGFDDKAWRTVNLPHDWSIEGPYDENAPTGGGGGYLPAGVGWYRREFNAPNGWRGKKVFVEFDGVYENSDVWLNGHHLGNRPFGYISFEYDLTPYLQLGKNVLAVRVDNSKQPNSRWYSGSGIYRHVWITVTSPVRVAQWGTYVTTPAVTDQSATVNVRTRVQNELNQAQEISLVSEIVGPDGKVAATARQVASVPAGVQEIEQSIEVPGPRLWSLDTPTLYTLRTIVQAGGKVVDEYDTPFGIRTIHYDVDKGFFLNGQPIKMQGMCLHETAGSVGAAIPIGVWQRELNELKAMGCNAIRTSHNPPAPEFLDLCDKMGFLVMDEAFDEWTWPKVRQGYAQYFKEWSQRDLTDMLHRDRNHPCVVLWSVGNEIGEQTDPNGPEIVRPLVATCHREDPTRPVTAACDNVYTDHGGATLDFLNALDIVGYNYAGRWGSRRETYFSDDRHQFPDRKFVGTEDTSVYSQRGDYEFLPLGPTGVVRASYETSMIDTEQLWKFIRDYDYVIGDFFWTGIDYLGESRWPRKLATSGALDTCGLPKDSYYFYQSVWTTKPMLHLLPHWNWAGREGQVIPVVCFTNCSTVELFLNGKSLGAKALEFPREGTAGGWNRYGAPRVFPTTADLHLSWDVPYAPGTLKAVGYDRSGKQVCEEEVHTAGAPAKLLLTSDQTVLNANGQDVAHLTVTVLDAQGNMVPTADNQVTFAVNGAGSLIGVDNGDPASHEDYKASQRKAYSGMCLAIVQAGRSPGRISVTASADGLQSSTVELSVSKPAVVVPTLP